MKKWATISVAFIITAATTIIWIPLMVVTVMGTDPGSSCSGQGSNPPAGADVAPTDTGVLADAQRGHARTIIAVGEQMSIPRQGIVVALATGSQESGLRMLANDGTDPRLAPDQRDVAESLNYPHDGVGRDHGSVNFMQQQYPWWGTVDELMNPQIAAVKFYEALLKVPGWDSMPVAVAAQTVQGSQFPDAYADDEVIARQLYAELRGAGADAPPLPEGHVYAAASGEAYEIAVSEVLCGNGKAMDCAPTANPAEEGLTPDALRVMRCITEHFGPRPWANVGERPSGVDRDHQEGRAVDAMMTGGEDDYRTPGGKGKGDKIAEFVVQNADALGVKYVIWYEKIWTRNGNGVGTPGSWAPYDYPLGGNSTDTVAHRDHVHVSVYGNGAAGSAPGATGDGNSRSPIDPGKYTLTSGYGYRDNPTGSGGQFHAGLDFSADAGTRIYATNGGTITEAGNAGDGYGNKVVITDRNTSYLYGHQIDGGIKVRPGDVVEAGTEIGAVGTTGDSTGNHLHYEIRIDGKSTDPMPYLQNQGVNA
ncbi:M23 family metallopeptidase [Rhodococcus opacus]|uniref:M23 family metallopeptidase n=1 Tax=Rhodococcus opacus TaxID=37919 RepID=UPI0029C258F7|nr:M23 family metallopeptidase [Rhodococcus opacus]MDX5961796.1 M23 family metallopeptidase [Rhodococcus opacus]